MGNNFNNHVIQNVIADKDELKWYFDYCIFPLKAWESYSAVLVCRHKKLTDEEKQSTGLTRAEAEFLKTEVLRCPKFRSGYENKNITFEQFYKMICRLNFDKEAYLTPTGDYLPSKTLAVLFYVNPCDDIKVWDAVNDKIQEKRTGLIKASLNDKKVLDYIQDIQTFGNVDNLIKHAKALNKGSTYWMDFDIDVPAWWKDRLNPYFNRMKETLNDMFGFHNYVIIQTSGGYHVLVHTSAVHSNPKEFCSRITKIYRNAVSNGMSEYVNEKGVVKFECVMSGPSIPGVPLPGTFQYDNPVTVVNKGDFDDVC